jgi:hypothetical protein
MSRNQAARYLQMLGWYALAFALVFLTLAVLDGFPWLDLLAVGVSLFLSLCFFVSRQGVLRPLDDLTPPPPPHHTSWF